MTKLKEFFLELKARNVRKTLAIYVGAALTTVGIVKLFMETYDLGTSFLPIIVTILTCGIASAFVFAWFHGKEGAQNFSKKEALLHSLIGIVAIAFSIRFTNAPARSTLPQNAKSIAVLPFENMNDDKEDGFFSDGITEDILTQLSKIGELSVIARSSTIRYKKSPMALGDIARELGVGTILRGNVRRVGNRVRIDGKLTDAKNDEILWAGTYDRELKDIFAIQTEVATTIARELLAKLSPQEEKLIQKQPTRNLDAYQYYLNGRDYYYRHTKDENEQAIVLFRKAIVLDSTYALAFAGLADAYAQRYQRYGFPEHWADSSIALSERAIALDPNIAEPYKSLGLAYFQKEWYQRAMQQWRKALTLNPNFAAVYSNMGEVLDWTGHQDEALPLILKGIRLQPGRAGDAMKVGSVFFSLGLFDQSARWFKRASELNPAMTGAYANLAEVSYLQGRFAEARAHLDSVRKKNPGDPTVLMTSGNTELYDRKYDKALAYYSQLHAQSPDQIFLTTVLGFAMLKTGRTKEGNALLDQSIALNNRLIADQSEEGGRRYDLARVYAIRGDITQSLEWLRESIQRGSGIVPLIERDPILEALHGRQEFQEMLNGVKKNVEAMRTRVLAMDDDILTAASLR